MPSKSLVSSWTAFFVPSGSRASHPPPQKPYPKNLPVSHPRILALGHLRGLWKGVSSSPPKKNQSASDRVLPPASPTISISGTGTTLVTVLVSRPTPIIPDSESALPFFSSPSPSSSSPIPPTWTPGPIPSGVDTVTSTPMNEDGSCPTTTTATTIPRPILPLAADSAGRIGLGLGPLSESRRQPVISPSSPSRHSKYPSPSPSPHSGTIPTSESPLALVAGAPGSSSSPSSSPAVAVVLDAATRLRDFRALIAEMRATLLLHCDRDLKEEEVSDAGNRDDTDNDNDDKDNDNDDERERLVRLLEDVMRKVKQLAEKEAASSGHSGHRD